MVIATPPQLHFPIAKAFLERGIDVICEKPMTRDLTEAQELVHLVRDNDRIFCLTHCYSGFPMTRQARALINQGAIGRVRLIDVIFAVGDPGTAVDPEDPADRHWRFRATSIGKASILGEVNSHAYHMAGFVTGLEGQRVSAHLATFAKNREVFDNVFATVEFSDGAVGRFWSSYVAAGNDQGFSFVIIGETGQLRWSQEDWNTSGSSRSEGRRSGIPVATTAMIRARPGMIAFALVTPKATASPSPTFTSTLRRL